MVPFNLTYLHCLQHSLFEHPFHLYCYSLKPTLQVIGRTEDENQHFLKKSS